MTKDRINVLEAEIDDMERACSTCDATKYEFYELCAYCAKKRKCDHLETELENLKRGSAKGSQGAARTL